MRGLPFAPELRAAATHTGQEGQQAWSARFRDPIISLITQGYAVVKLPQAAQQAVWLALDGISQMDARHRRDFSFPAETDGFLPKGGEHAKYTNNVDLCDRFCFWHRRRADHAAHAFADTPLYGAIGSSEAHLWALAQELVSGLWRFFHSDDKVEIRDSSYVQLCMYENDYQISDRVYLQDRHEDGHLITLIKPTRDGLVIYPDNVETPVRLADDEVIAITGSLITALSDGQILPMYHAVRNPMMALSRKSLVYFAIPDLHRPYTTLLAKKTVHIAAMADESHQAFGNTPLV